jgi:pimeloyl-ACP methyl ester carboxylesterase
VTTARTPLVLLHGINASPRVWSPLLPQLSAVHDVCALALAGHRGGRAWPDDRPVELDTMADLIEAELDARGLDNAHLAGNSLGGWLAIELARRGRARSVVALSPAGGWSTFSDLQRLIRLISRGRVTLIRHRARLAPLLRPPQVRRLVLRTLLERGDRLTVDDLRELFEDVAGCTVFDDFVAWVRRAGPIHAAELRLGVPLRVAWGDCDRATPFARYGAPLLAVLPEAEHVELAGVGHLPMYDDPDLVARTILEITSGGV